MTTGFKVAERILTKKINALSMTDVGKSHLASFRLSLCFDAEYAVRFLGLGVLFYPNLPSKYCLRQFYINSNG